MYVNYEQESEESSDSPDEEGSTQSSESKEDDIRKITSHHCHTRKEKISKPEPKTDNGQPKMQMDKAIDNINAMVRRSKCWLPDKGDWQDQQIPWSKYKSIFILTSLLYVWKTRSAYD